MTNQSTSPYLHSALLGVMAAMRTWSPVFLTSYRASQMPESPLGDSLLSPLASPLATAATGTIAAVELAADKLAVLPNRIRADAWIARTIAGAFAGAAWARTSKADLKTGALVGGAAAALATFTLFHLRKAGGKSIPDLVLGVVEDLALAGIGVVLLKSVGDGGQA